MTREGLPEIETSAARGSPLTISTAGVRAGVLRTEEITTTARASAANHDQYASASPTRTATNTR